MMCDSSVAGPVIHVAVPSANEPASRNMTGPRAATNTGGAGASISSGPSVVALTVSPSKVPGSPRSRGINASRYSRMWRAGCSNE